MKHSVLRGTAWLAVATCLVGFRAPAGADPAITFTQDDIQRIVYSGHLMTLIDRSPELEAGLLLLLELDRRNPDTDPARIVEMAQAALERYRMDVMARATHLPTRDDLLADFLCQFLGTGELFPGTGSALGTGESALGTGELKELRPPTLSILHSLLADAYTATSGSTIRAHAGNEEVLGREHARQRSQTTVEQVMQRIHASPRFRVLAEALLSLETPLPVLSEPDLVLDGNEALAASPTMQRFAGLYAPAEGGPVALFESELDSLFQQEMAILRATISANQDLIKTLNRQQDELSSYLADPLRVEAMRQVQESSRLGLAERISASGAATHVISSSFRASTFEKARQMRTVANSTAEIARGLQAIDAATKLSKLTACTNFLSAGLGLVSLFMESGPSADELILQEIGALKEMIHDLATHMDYRFDRVDQALNVVLDQLDYSIQLIGEVGHDVDALRLELLDVQAGLCRLERELYSYLNAGFRRSFVERLNGDLRYEARTGEPMAWGWYRDTAENAFYSWAVSHSKDELSSYLPMAADLTDEALASQLQARPLESNLNYIGAFLHQRLGVPALSSKPVASPRDWFAGADAYLRLAVENPLHFRRMNVSRLEGVIGVGRELADFLGRLSLQDNGEPQTALFDALLDYMNARLETFLAAVEMETVQHAELSMNQFAYEMWRDWDNAAQPEFLTDAAVDGSMKTVRVPNDVIDVDSSGHHVLALRANGTVIAWGSNWSGECDVPAEATDIVEVEAGGSHSLALKADGTVIAWGSNFYGACDVPPGLGDVVKIDAGPYHNMALRRDGTIAVWGYRANSPELQVPEHLTEVIDIAAGGDGNRDLGCFCVALQSDGSVTAWGDNWEGRCDVPPTLANGVLDVIQVAAMWDRGAAVLADGTVIAWPHPLSPSGPVRQLSMFSSNTTPIALLQDGTVDVLGEGMDEGLPTGNDIVRVTSGGSTAAALHADGALTIWGSTSGTGSALTQDTAIQAIAGSASDLLLLLHDGSVHLGNGQLAPPIDLPGVRQIDVGSIGLDPFALALTEEGTVVAWGGNSKGQCTVPENLTDVVSVSAASNGTHSLALKRDGTVVAWGNNDFGQCNVPGDLGDVVAISGGWRHSTALKADGTVKVWGATFLGSTFYDLHNIPAGLKDVVAIASGYTHNLALRANGLVVAWGTNTDGACSIPPGLAEVVAIDAGSARSVALKADGSVVAWGNDAWGEGARANAMTGVYQLACGDTRGDIFLVNNAFPSRDDASAWPYQRRIPYTQAVTAKIAALYGHVLDEIPFDLNDSARDLTAAKQLLRSVVALALPESFEQDDVLRGCLLGTEGLAEANTFVGACLAEIERLESSRWARMRDMGHLFQNRASLFRNRLTGRLEAVAAAGQSELPRMVGHTLALLESLRAAHHAGETPSPVFDMCQLTTEPGDVTTTLCGEPFLHYRLEASVDLGTWQETGLGIADGDGLSLQPGPASEARFYRATVP